MSVNQVRKLEDNLFDVLSFALLNMIIVPTVFNMCLDSFMSAMSLAYVINYFYISS